MIRFLALCVCVVLGIINARAANSPVSSLPAAAALTGTELIYCVQSGGDFKCTTQAIANASVVNPLVGWGASGSTATTAGSCSSSTTPTILTVGSVAGWAVGNGIDVPGAGAAAADLVTSVTAVGASTLTLNNGCSTTVSGVTVNHDDTAAMSAAITAALSLSKPFYLQGGGYNVTSALTAVNSPLTMYGDGRTQSMIWNRSATATILTINYQNSLAAISTTISATLRDFGISGAAGITPTAGGGLLLGSSTACGPCTQYTSALSINNVTLNGLWAAIKTQNGLIRNWFTNIDINQSVGTCTGTAGTSGGAIVYNSPSPSGDNEWDVQIAMTTAGDGVCILSADTQTWRLKVNTGAGGTGGGVKFKGGTILRQRFVDPSIEGNGTSPSCAFDFNTGSITQVTITGYEIALIPNLFCNTANVSGSLSIIPGIATDNANNPIAAPMIVRPMPTSSAGLASGTWWNNSGVPNIIP